MYSTFNIHVLPQDKYYPVTGKNSDATGKTALRYHHIH